VSGDIDIPVPAPQPAAVAGACQHCGLPVPAGASNPAFCCPGCAAAYALVSGYGLEGYYRRRCLAPDQRPLRPEADAPAAEYAAYAQDRGDGRRDLDLVVEGLHCAACVWLIESILCRQPGVVSARVNMTTRRLHLCWRGEPGEANTLADVVNRLGYRVVPIEAAALGGGSDPGERALLRALAVAGFAAGNIMLLSVSVWAGHSQGMGPATRDLFHWISALIAMPAVAYAGRPFFRSALAVLRHGRTNMDVPISLGVVLATAMSLHETVRGAPHAYFDSAVGLLFFLLVGRYLDSRARGRARSTVEQLLMLRGAAVTLVADDGTRQVLPPSRIAAGANVLVAAGERVGVDGIVVSGSSDIDTSLIDGETLPKPVSPGTTVFAGTMNVTAALTVAVTAVGEGTLLAEIARMIEAAEAQKSRHVALADRIARYYTPFVHTAALATFVGWWTIGNLPWQQSLLTAVAVLIITCPCALALAVPAVQVIAVSRLLRQGILVKSGTALERLASADTIAFDKTGTLTVGQPILVNADDVSDADLTRAATLAAASRHPLAQALVRAAIGRGAAAEVAPEVRELPGQGLELASPEGSVRLGSRSFCAVGETRADATGPELWLVQPSRAAVHFRFADTLRPDAATVVAALRQHGYPVTLVSGDRAPAVAAAAQAAGIADWQASLSPADKVAHLTAVAAGGRRLLMVGDGLNDAPALTAAHVSMSPSSAIDISQNAADVVFQGTRLAPVVETLGVSRRARWLVMQNLAFSFLYNAATIPLAVAGHVTPLVAAIAMSGSSILVTLNALRLSRGRAW
jgi:Cu2+-exporting ATPase